MHGMHQMLLKLGIPTYSDTYYTQLTGATPTKIGQTMPSVIGLIYGLSVDVNGTTPQNNTFNCITPNQSTQLWLQLKIGAALYVDNFRLDRLVFSDGGTNFQNPNRYFPVMVPSETDLKESTFYNPNSIGSGGTPIYVPLTVHYIDKPSYAHMLQKGYLYANAHSAPSTPNAPTPTK
jgi:hypothetical protein